MSHHAVGDSPFLEIPSPEVLRHKKFLAKLSHGFRHGQFFRVVNDTSTVDVINSLYTADVSVSLGLFNKFEVSALLPLHYASGENINTEAAYNGFALGDVALFFKGVLWPQNDDSERLSLSLQGFLRVPSGEEGQFLGHPGFSGGVDLLAGYRIKRVLLFWYVGVEFLNQRTIQTIVFDDNLRFGAGLRVPIPYLYHSALSVELLGQLPLSGASRVTSPMEVSFAWHQEYFEESLRLSVGAGLALNNAVGNSNAKAMLSIGYRW